MHWNEGRSEAKYTAGLYCSVYREAGNTTLRENCVTDNHARVLLVGEGVSGYGNVSDAENMGLPVLYLHGTTHRGGGTSYFASPSPQGMGYMFGGNFIYTLDKRLPGNMAIPVHDLPV